MFFFGIFETSIFAEETSFPHGYVQPASSTVDIEMDDCGRRDGKDQ